MLTLNVENDIYFFVYTSKINGYRIYFQSNVNKFCQLLTEVNKPKYFTECRYFYWFKIENTIH